ncbi:type 1 periplasmic binding fold superfamily protein [Polaribacter sp.]|uniref:type 1 periplasmic binding fold superfamily protein n=1 Tax=Polaribacter sp. TaxID=1920175 RepID=UPI003F6C36A4
MKISNTYTITKLLAILFISVLSFTSCEDEHDDHHHDHEEELITTVNYTLTNGNDIVTLTFSDPDGEGGNDGTYNISGPLTANTTYTGIVELLNESESPAEDITEEVKTEGDEHEFFYSTNIATITKTDEDADGNPLGIETSVVTGNAGSGSITVVLIHEPTKPNTGLANAGGSRDVEVTFNVTIQ